MGYQNGDAILSHCPLCQAQFEESQKLGDIIECDNCETKYQLNIKK